MNATRRKRNTPGGVLAAKPDAKKRHNDTRERVYALVCEKPGRTAVDMGKVLGINHAGVSVHLYRLLRAGLVERVGSGNQTRYIPVRHAGRCPLCGKSD